MVTHISMINLNMHPNKLLIRNILAVNKVMVY